MALFLSLYTESQDSRYKTLKVGDDEYRVGSYDPDFINLSSDDASYNIGRGESVDFGDGVSVTYEGSRGGTLGEVRFSIKAPRHVKLATGSRI